MNVCKFVSLFVCDFRRFQQLRLYRDEIETRDWEQISLLFSNDPKGSFSCKVSIDSTPQRRTIIYRPGQPVDRGEKGSNL